MGKKSLREIQHPGSGSIRFRGFHSIWSKIAAHLMNRQGKPASLTLYIVCGSLNEADDEPPPQVKERTRALFPILVGQSCCFALIAMHASGVGIRTGQVKTSLRSFLRQFGRRGSDAPPRRWARMR